MEFAKVTIGEKSYLIRGDSHGTTIPADIFAEMKRHRGILEFHSHPFNDDCAPSLADRALIRELRSAVGQRTSMIVTPNGRTCTFGEHGVLEMGTVPNKINNRSKAVYMQLFGGE